MLVTLKGIYKLVRLVQFENAKSPILVTLSGIFMFERLQQLLNTPSMRVTPYGIFILLSLMHEENAQLQIFLVQVNKYIR